MCILFIAIGKHPHYPLIIAANRDEYHARATAPMHHWRDAPGILAGRDLVAGGTWFGVNASGRIAAVTNHRAARDAHSDPPQSRGELVARFLRGDDTPTQYAAFVREHQSDFGPFNLLFGTPDELHCASSTDPRIRALKPGVHSISNGDLDDPWPKMSRGVALLQSLLASGDEIDRDALLRAMRDETQADDSLLPETNLGRAREQQLSSIFITGTDYGTRATTLLLCTADRFELRECNYAPSGEATEQRRFALEIESGTEERT